MHIPIPSHGPPVPICDRCCASKGPAASTARSTTYHATRRSAKGGVQWIQPLRSMGSRSSSVNLAMGVPQFVLAKLVR